MLSIACYCLCNEPIVVAVAQLVVLSRQLWQSACEEFTHPFKVLKNAHVVGPKLWYPLLLLWMRPQ